VRLAARERKVSFEFAEQTKKLSRGDTKKFRHARKKKLPLSFTEGGLFCRTLESPSPLLARALHSTRAAGTRAYHARDRRRARAAAAAPGGGSPRASNTA